MKKFMDDAFLLQSDLAVKLFNEVKDLPIIDYHCHLEPKEIGENKQFTNVAQMWLGGDHYKWRLMRANGIDECYITGDASDYEKFEKFAETVDMAIGSPIHHWTHLEMKRYFNCDLVLCKENAKAIWEQCNAVITGGSFSVWDILKKFKVEAVCTTDDPVDLLEHHKSVAGKTDCTVLPTFRPSNALNIEEPTFRDYVVKLQEASGVVIESYASLLKALEDRINYFHMMGCRLSDHALDPPVFYDNANEALADGVLKNALNGKTPDITEVGLFKTKLMVDLGRLYAEKGWTMQIHVNALRSVNDRRLKQIGRDSGYDCIMDDKVSRPVAKLLNALDTDDKLPKTILYSLNPADDDILAVLIGCFQDGKTRGKIQHGSAWWVNDTKTGMEKQMISLANNGLLAAFVGMLTDSRSFLSYTRHEYFRRIMCNLLATWVINGEFPDDFDRLATIAKNIAYYNAKAYFGF